MNEEVRKDILNVLNETIDALQRHDSRSLRHISNHTIHNSSIFQDKDSINMAVVVYSLSKFVDRMKNGMEIIEHLKCAKGSLEANNIEEYEKCLSDAMNLVSEIDKKLSLYVKHIINQAGIKKGSKVYEHGVSLARAAEIFNISQWELMRYLGQSNSPDNYSDDMNVKDRISHARKLFGVGE